MKRFVSLLACLFVLVGCSSGDDDTGGDSGPRWDSDLAWDLSAGHARGDIDWPAAESGTDPSVATIDEVRELRITLPGGQVFEADEDVVAVQVERFEDVVTYIQVDFVPESAQEAFARVERLAATWKFDLASFRGWLDEVEEIRGRGGAEVQAETRPSAAAPGIEIGPDTPLPVVQVREAPEGGPWVVSFQLTWQPA